MRGGQDTDFEADPEGHIGEKRKKFKVESVPLHCTRAPQNYQNDPRLKKFSHTSGVEIVIHFSRFESPWSLVSFKLHYNATSLNSSSHPGRTNEMNNVPRLRQKAIVYKKHLSDSEYNKMLQPDQNSVDLLQYKIES